jgi:hypothetical protein
MKNNSLWSNETEAQFEKSKLNIEKFIFIKLHKFLFATDFDDALEDEKLSQRIQSLAFLSPEHLDMKYINDYCSKNNSNDIVSNDIENSWRQAIKIPVSILQELYDMKSPEDKLYCVKRCSLAIAAELKKCHKDGSYPGADEFLPMMILVLKECNPRALHSTVKYLQAFTHPSRLVSESGYLLTHFVSAVQFLEHVDSDALTVSTEEFEASIKKCKLDARQETSKALANNTSARNISADKSYKDSLFGHLKNSAAFQQEKEQKMLQNLLSKYYGDCVDSAAGNGSSTVTEDNYNEVIEKLLKFEGFDETNQSDQIIMDGSHVNRQLISSSNRLNTIPIGKYRDKSIESLTFNDFPSLLEEYKLLLRAYES